MSWGGVIGGWGEMEGNIIGVGGLRGGLVWRYVVFWRCSLGFGEGDWGIGGGVWGPGGGVGVTNSCLSRRWFNIQIF